MNILNFKQANCKNCYKCLRNCPSKAISFSDDNAQVIDDRCILCGHCVSVCPQNAKEVKSYLNVVIDWINNGERVYASVAPSCVSSFPNGNPENLFAALEQLGFVKAEPTAIGAKLVSAEYERLLNEGTYKNFITSACPAVVRMIQYDYHSALKYLAPVESPMVAHGRYMRDIYGDDIKVVFIGPCIAKMREADESGIVDLAITFEELEHWLSDKHIDINNVVPTCNDNFRDRSLFYPISRGIIKSLYGYKDGYDYVYVDGVARCAEVLENIDNLSGMFIEMSACENSCVNGPCNSSTSGGFLKANETVRKYAKTNIDNPTPLQSNIVIEQNILPKSNQINQPSDKELSAILAKIGKLSASDLLNCGACGYNSCIDKAIAVYNGMANIEMCIPYMRERAENLSAEIFKNSPNAVIAINYDLVIQEMNDVARDMYGIKEYSVRGKNLVDYINPTEFMMAMSGEQIIDHKIYISETNRWGRMSIYKVDKHDMVLCTVNDITKDVAFEESMRKVRLETAETTQKVIEKQMSIVQEIASLLGETTADTKVALTKLKNVVMKEGD